MDQLIDSEVLGTCYQKVGQHGMVAGGVYGDLLGYKLTQSIFPCHSSKYKGNSIDSTPKASSVSTVESLRLQLSSQLSGNALHPTRYADLRTLHHKVSMVLSDIQTGG